MTDTSFKATRQYIASILMAVCCRIADPTGPAWDLVKHPTCTRGASAKSR
jgi:hypothetical protein